MDGSTQGNNSKGKVTDVGRQSSNCEKTMKPGAIIRTYITQIRPHANEELDWFRRQPTLSEVISLAAFAVSGKGKRYSLQSKVEPDHP